jgi:hypothetical protein
MPSATTTCSRPGMQGTGGSTAMANSWDQLRQPAPPPAPCWCRPPPSAGTCPPPRSACAKASSVACRQQAQGHLRRAGRSRRGRSRAASVSLKDPKDFRLIGRTPRARTALPRPTAAPNSPRTCTCPACWWRWWPTRRASAASCKSFDARKAKAIKGVVDVVAIPEWRGRAGDRHLDGQEGPRCAERRMGRQRCLQARHRRDAGPLPCPGPEPRPGRPQGRRCRTRLAAAGTSTIKAGIRLPLPGPCRHGADELRHPAHGRRPARCGTANSCRPATSTLAAMFGCKVDR